MFGLAPVLDFDGTIARLEVDWARLRDQLGVRRIDDLWQGDPAQWGPVRDAEVNAASRAAPIEAVTEGLRSTASFAVLTSNSSAAVWTFVDRFPDLRDRLRTVVGREELGGPKGDFVLFSRGIEHCLTATQAERGGSQPVYVGDSTYELEFASELGLKTIAVAELTETWRRQTVPLGGEGKQE